MSTPWEGTLKIIFPIISKKKKRIYKNNWINKRDFDYVIIT